MQLCDKLLYTLNWEIFMRSTELADFSFTQAFVPIFPSMSLYLHLYQLINPGNPGNHHRGQ